MKNKTKMKLLAYSAVPVIGLGFLAGTSIASARGFSMFGFGNSSSTPEQVAQWQNNMFQNEANLLGISADDVKSGWAQGKSFLQIAQEHNISQSQLQQKIKDYRLQQVKNQLQTLVSQGVITQAQADQRLQFIQSNQNQNGKMFRGMMGAFGHFHF